MSNTETNPTLTPRSKYLRREMTEWSYRQLVDLFKGDTNFALYMHEADHHGVFFYEHGECWMMCQDPTGNFDQAAPEVVEDWIGSSAPKEPGAEPVLMHREELPKSVKAMIDHVKVVEPKHVHEQWEEMDL